MNGSISESVFMILVRHFRGESNLYLHRCLHTIVHEGNGPHAPGQMAQLMWIYTLFNRCEHTYIIQPCIMGSHNFKGTASSVFGIHCWLQCNMYIAVQYVYCSAIYIYIYIYIYCTAIYNHRKGRNFGAWLLVHKAGHMMVCGLPSRKKKGKGRVKLQGQPYQRHSGTFLVHSLYWPSE